jgi:hypothetical protein
LDRGIDAAVSEIMSHLLFLFGDIAAMIMAAIAIRRVLVSRKSRLEEEASKRSDFFRRIQSSMIDRL